MNKDKILRPPLHTSFELPTREELLALKVGDTVNFHPLDIIAIYN